MAMTRLVVVGCGSIGQRHARLLASREDLSVELCDQNVDGLAETVAAIGERPCYRDFHEALASRPDAVVVATPHAHHAEQVIAAVNAGVHVLCEKPMTDSLDDAYRVADAAAKAGVVVDVGFTNHFHPALIRLKDLVQSGELGTVVHVHCRVGTYATLACSRSRYQASEEGALLYDYVHQPDLFFWLLGMEPAGVTMSAIQAGDMPLSSMPNVADLMLDYDAPLRATIHLNYVQMPQRHEYEVVGDRAWALLDADANRLRIGHRSVAHESSETFDVDRDRMFVAEHQAFLDAVAGKRQPESPPQKAIVSIRVVEAALRSWKTGMRVAIDRR